MTTLEHLQMLKIPYVLWHFAASGGALPPAIAVLQLVSVVLAVPALLEPAAPGPALRAEVSDSITCHHHSDDNTADACDDFTDIR